MPKWNVFTRYSQATDYISFSECRGVSGTFDNVQVSAKWSLLCHNNTLQFQVTLVQEAFHIVYYSSYFILECRCWHKIVSIDMCDERDSLSGIQSACIRRGKHCAMCWKTIWSFIVIGTLSQFSECACTHYFTAANCYNFGSECRDQDHSISFPKCNGI